MDEVRRQARIAGLLYTLVALTAPIGLLILPHVTLLGDVGGLLEFGEPPIILWLLIWGARKTRSHP